MSSSSSSLNGIEWAPCFSYGTMLSLWPHAFLTNYMLSLWAADLESFSIARRTFVYIVLRSHKRMRWKVCAAHVQLGLKFESFSQSTAVREEFSLSLSLARLRSHSQRALLSFWRKKFDVWCVCVHLYYYCCSDCLSIGALKVYTVFLSTDYFSLILRVKVIWKRVGKRGDCDME